MEEKKSFIINVIFVGIIIGLIYLFFKYVAGAILPFVIGFILAYLAIKLTKKVIKKDNKIVRIICLVVIYAIISVLATFIISFGINKIIEFLSAAPEFFKNTIEPLITLIKNYLEDISVNLPKEIAVYLNTFINDLFESINSIILSISKAIVSLATSIVTGAPDLLISIMVLIISSFYFLLDYEKVHKFCSDFFDDRVKKYYHEVQDFISNKLLKILASYLKIMLITFIELAIGLLIFGVDNAIIISLLIAVLDIFPVLGVGTVLIPWGIIDLIIGNTLLGIEVLALYLVITIIRNIIEPRLVGGDLGLHPLITLITMIVGLDLFGIIGMFGFPLIISFFINRKESI